jgi:hypothetical protein
MEVNCKGLSMNNCLPPNCKYINGEKRKYCRSFKNNRNPVRDFNKCRGIEKPICLPPDCKYAEGPKRQFCRISKNTRKQDKTNNNNSTEKYKAANIIKKFMKNKTRRNNRINNENTDLERDNKAASIIQKLFKNNRNKTIKERKEKLAVNKIGKFFIKKRDNIRSNFLTRVCSDSGVCLAFGKESDKIKSFFNDFLNYQYKNKVIELSKGDNGVVFEIEYERLKYKAYTILKVSKYKDSDNLMYEYFVGLFINTIYKKFPCFLETYGVCINPLNFNNQKFINISSSSKDDVQKLIHISCEDPTIVGLQIEYLKNPLRMRDILPSVLFWRKSIISVLFQIYFPLFYLRDVFTHYDLHRENVLLYEPIPNNYIHYHYHLDNGVIVSFKCSYIAKIIDYGRCYFNNKKDNINSVDIRKMVCDENECNKGMNRCGDGLGYIILDKETDISKSFHYINSSRVNRSHDLRLLYYVSENYKSEFKNNLTHNIYFDKDMETLFDKIKYTKEFGTKENINSGLPRSVNNISDAFKLLTKICTSQGFLYTNDNEFNDPDKKLGDLHIYTDRDMIFTSRKI